MPNHDMVRFALRVFCLAGAWPSKHVEIALSQGPRHGAFNVWLRACVRVCLRECQRAIARNCGCVRVRVRAFAPVAIVGVSVFGTEDPEDFGAFDRSSCQYLPLVNIVHQQVRNGTKAVHNRICGTDKYSVNRSYKLT